MSSERVMSETNDITKVDIGKPKNIQNVRKESSVVKPKVEKGNLSSCAVKKEEGIETKSIPCLASPKNRRKIRQPKQYKPRTMEDMGTNGAHENPEDQIATISPRSSEKTVDQTSVENGVYVVTASLETNPIVSDPSPKRPGPKQRKPGRKPRHPNPTIPKKPEELIREAMASGQPTPQATKRDAQYRKSYAYKIWKEKSNCEVRSESNENNALGPGGQRGMVNPHVASQQHQARGTYYWSSNNYNGTNNTGFYPNGNYYGVNPPQVIHGVHSGPSVPQPAVTIPQITQPSQVPPAGGQALGTKAIQTANSGTALFGVNRTKQRITTKKGPPNVIVVSQYAQKVQENHVSSTPSQPVVNSSSSPPSSGSHDINQINTASLSQTTITQNSQTGKLSTMPQCPSSQSDSPSEETIEEEATMVSTNPTNLVSLMKSSLRKKHCKENVQPLPVSFKSKLKTKRKLDSTDKNDSTSAKKSSKPTIFTPLNEQEAEKLANDIYDVNLEYFPFQTLAEKAAQDNGDKTTKAQTTTTKNKVKEIERVRCLLKDFYDVTHSCSEDPDMEKFDSASRKFGRKNILNHLSLLDRYFAELQKRVEFSA